MSLYDDDEVTDNQPEADEKDPRKALLQQLVLGAIQRRGGPPPIMSAGRINPSISSDDPRAPMSEATPVEQASNRRPPIVGRPQVASPGQSAVGAAISGVAKVGSPGLGDQNDQLQEQQRNLILSRTNPALQEEQRLQSSPAGWRQIHNPFLRTVAGIGDTALNMMASRGPLAAALGQSLPGTTLHHNALLNNATQAADQGLAQEKVEADTAKDIAAAKPAPVDKAGNYEVKEGIDETGKPVTGRLNKLTNVFEPTSGIKPKPEKQPEGEMRLPTDRIVAYNKELALLHPGDPDILLPTDATQKDFDRVKSLIDDANKRLDRKTQQDLAAAQRATAESMKLIALGDKEQKPIFGRDPKTGQELMVSQADARKRGLTDIIDPPSPEVAKALSAREFIPLGERANALIDKLDKEGKLGPLASRWNEFLAGNFGAGDADYEQLRTVMGLSTTKLMQLHVGARGGAYIMEHFEDLANAKKMDANVLRAGLKEELAYAHDIARDPNVRSEQKAGGFAAWKQRQGNQ